MLLYDLQCRLKESIILAVNRSDEIIITNVLPEELKGFTERDINWLWHFMASYYHLPNESGLNLSFKTGCISQHLTNNNFANLNNQFNVYNILKSHYSHVIEIYYFDWIDPKNYRQLIWASKTLFTDVGFYFLKVDFKIYYDLIIKYFDRLPLYREEKIQFLSDKKQEWARFKTPDADLKWIDINNTIQLNWAWTYLLKLSRSVQVPNPVSNDEYYGAVLASFDAMSYGSYAEKQLFISKMKKTWSQKKFRDSGKSKKPYHLPLTQQTKKRLDELAQLYGAKANEVLENLINEAYTKEILDEQGKKQYRP